MFLKHHVSDDFSGYFIAIENLNCKRRAGIIISFLGELNIWFVKTNVWLKAAFFRVKKS